jgi:hypothetical protein
MNSSESMCGIYKENVVGVFEFLIFYCLSHCSQSHVRCNICKLGNIV